MTPPDLLTTCREQVPELDSWVQDPASPTCTAFIDGGTLTAAPYGEVVVQCPCTRVEAASDWPMPGETLRATVRRVLRDLADDGHEVGRRLLALLEGGDA